jgi:cobalt-precorrin 5A hydrolase/precorrin-3B C17-methyltransferase
MTGGRGHDTAPGAASSARPERIVALGFSPEAKALLERLRQGVHLAAIRWPSESLPAGAWLEQQWPEATAVLAVGACGLVTRLIAPLLRDKLQDPAVLVLDPAGRFVVPLLGGHTAGAERLSQELAALLAAQAVLSGGCQARGDLALDAFGSEWGWRRGAGDWSALMRRRAAGLPIRWRQEGGTPLWRQLQATARLEETGLQETDLVESGLEESGLEEAAADPVDPQEPGRAAAEVADLVIGPRLGPGCRWHPPCLWLGMGCERGTDLALLERLVQRGLAAAGLAESAVAGLASIDRKGDELALLELARRHGWPLRLFGADALAAVAVPNPSDRVAAEMGTGSVAEAAALLAAQAHPPWPPTPDQTPVPAPGSAPTPTPPAAPPPPDQVPVPVPAPASTPSASAPAQAPAAAAAPVPTLEPEPGLEPELGSRLAEPAHWLLPKTIERPLPHERGAATLAIAQSPEQFGPERGELHLIGAGPGALSLLSGEARQALARCTVWVGYGLYLDLLEPLRRPDQLRRAGRLTAELDRCAEALALARAGLRVALVSSGDSGIYGMAGLALDLWLRLAAAERPGFTVHPGLSALQLAAARVGAPLMHDFCTISLSDRLTPWAVIERRLRAAAEGDFVVALYNPRSQGRDWQLGRAQQLLLAGRPANTPVVLARQLGRPGESVRLHRLGDLPLEEVDMLTLVLIGNSTSLSREGWMLTPRGYPGAELG